MADFLEQQMELIEEWKPEESDDGFKPAKSKKKKINQMEVQDMTEDELRHANVVPKFKPVDPENLCEAKIEFRKILVPPNRYTPLKANWTKLFTPVVEHLNLQMRYNIESKCIEVRSHPGTNDKSSIQKAADF